MSKYSKQFLTNNRIKEIENDIKSQLKMLNDPQLSARVSPHDVMKSIESKRKMIRENSPPPLTGAAKDKAWAMHKKLGRWIAEHAPKDKYVRFPTGLSHDKEHDFEKSVEDTMKWMQHGQKYVDAYRHIGARIDSSNDDLRNIQKVIRERRR